VCFGIKDKLTNKVAKNLGYFYKKHVKIKKYGKKFGVFFKNQ